MQEEVVAVLSARGLLPYLRGDVGSFSYANSLDAADNWVLKIVKKEIKKKKKTPRLPLSHLSKGGSLKCLLR